MTPSPPRFRQRFAVASAFKAALASSLYSGTFALLSALFYSLPVTMKNPELDIISGAVITLLAIGLPCALLCLIFSFPPNFAGAYCLFLGLTRRPLTSDTPAPCKLAAYGGVYGVFVYLLALSAFWPVFGDLLNPAVFFRLPFWLILPVAAASGMMSLDISWRAAQAFQTRAPAGTPSP